MTAGDQGQEKTIRFMKCFTRNNSIISKVKVDWQSFPRIGVVQEALNTMNERHMFASKVTAEFFVFVYTYNLGTPIEIVIVDVLCKAYICGMLG